MIWPHLGLKCGNSTLSHPAYPTLNLEEALLPKPLVCRKVIADRMVERDLTNTGE